MSKVLMLSGSVVKEQRCHCASTPREVCKQQRFPALVNAARMTVRLTVTRCCFYVFFPA
jgi:hypothetical protein